MKRRIFLKLGAGALMGPGLGAGLSACGGNGDDPRSDDPGGEPDAPPPGPPASPPEPQNTVVGWTGVALQAVRDAMPGPPMAARSLAIVYTCMYNAWCAYDPVTQPTRPPRSPRRPPAECTAPNKALAMSHAAYVALVDQFPSQRSAFDASDAKRAYDSVRPITAVRYMMAGRDMQGYGLPGPEAGLRTIKGEIWIPYQPMSFPTPPFPEYVSGHGCFSAAAVLTLSWETFSAAADEAGMSRICGGIHFDRGNTAGQLLGRKTGARVFAKACSLWQGAA